MWEKENTARTAEGRRSGKGVVCQPQADGYHKFGIDPKDITKLAKNF
ncbi:MAG: hypothetical protein J6O54_05220 [Prevotella sp.]|nr:hypothetical protein [Prevotella sp.]